MANVSNLVKTIQDTMRKPGPSTTTVRFPHTICE